MIEPPAEPSPVDPGEEVDPSEPISLVYYSLSRTQQPFTQWVNKTVTMTGYCTDYEGRVFCWDDGIHTIDFVNNHFRWYARNTFWAVDDDGTCLNQCAIDGMQSPVEIETNRFPLTVIDQYSVKKVEDVFTEGQMSQMACEKLNDTITCGSIIINL